MGADIHMYIEYKDNNGKWKLNEKQRCEACKGLESNFDCNDCFGNGYIECEIWRNYLLFSILADIRNEGDIIPISRPKGIPADASEEYIKISNNDLGNHSHSYHTLKQLKKCKGKYYGNKYDWEFLKGYLPKNLEKLAQKHGGDDNIRIVFFFDN